MSKKYSYQREKDEALIKHRNVRQLSAKEAAPVILSIVGAMLVYYVVGLVFKIKYIVHIYGIIMLVSGLLAGIFNHGFRARPPRWEDLPDKWSDERKQAELDTYESRHKKVRICLIAFISVAITFACDLLYLYYFSGTGTP